MYKRTTKAKNVKNEKSTKSIKVQKYFDREWPQDRHLVLNQK